MLAARNIRRMIGGSEKLVSYKPGFGTGQTFAFVSLGPDMGASSFGYVSLGHRVTRQIKSKYLFTAGKMVFVIKLRYAGSVSPPHNFFPKNNGKCIRNA